VGLLWRIDDLEFFWNTGFSKRMLRRPVIGTPFSDSNSRKFGLGYQVKNPSAMGVQG